MNVNTVFVVMTTRPAPNHDSGSWSRHENFADAAKLADQVDGTVWCKTDTDGRVVMTKMKTQPA